MRLLSNINLGVYYPVNSLIHQLDPRVKIFLGLFVTLGIFALKGFSGLLFLFLFFGFVLYLSEVPLSWIIKVIKPLYYILILAFIFQVFWTPGETLVHWWILRITREGLDEGFFVSLRLVLLMVFASLLTFTTTPIELTDGLESLLRPLKRLRVPVHELAMMMTIALRFIPVLLREGQKIIKAQKARGANFESGNLFKRAKALIPIFVPLFVSVYRKAEELGLAMESRCYRGGEGRRRMRSLRVEVKDGVALVAVFIILTIALMMR